MMTETTRAPVLNELLANLPRRVGVTAAAGSLARRNLISYSRGNVRILNSKGLQAASCECYEAVKAQYVRAPI